MAHKTFISYKYNEAKELRDAIVAALGKEYAQYYKGETSESPDLTDTSTDNIKQNLTNMMYDTSVTILIISPHMKESKWIDWELEYCLKKITRQGRTSQRNGIVGVIMKVDGGYGWFTNHLTNCHGKHVVNYKNEYLYPIIYCNHFNSNPPQWHCPQCRTYDYMSGSYITYVKEDDFLANPQLYIDNAYDKSENDACGYNIVPTR